jgi:hypothetical protein
MDLGEELLLQLTEILLGGELLRHPRQVVHQRGLLGSEDLLQLMDSW